MYHSTTCKYCVVNNKNSFQIKQSNNQDSGEQIVLVYKCCIYYIYIKVHPRTWIISDNTVCIEKEFIGIGFRICNPKARAKQVQSLNTELELYEYLSIAQNNKGKFQNPPKINYNEKRLACLWFGS